MRRSKYAYSEGCIDAPGWYCPSCRGAMRWPAEALRALRSNDDRPAILRLIAVCKLAHRDADRGDNAAHAWLAQIQANRP
ncbi:MAG: hypothetical protein HC828_01720 [Blastochloris sp.]|nr:hypothetical protein [Blastochloris sp.]